MSLQIAPLEASDVPAYARVELEAFQSHPRTPMMWTQGYTPAVYEYNESGKYKGLNDPHEHSIKCFETESGKLVGGATFTFRFREANGNLLGHGSPKNYSLDEKPPANWPEGGNWRMKVFYKVNMAKLLREHLGEEPFILLDNLTVLTSHQGRGIGKRLLLWGVAQADQRNLKMVLESTPAGRRVYESFGFRTEVVIRANMHDFGWTEPYDEDSAVRLFMIREPQSRKPLLNWRLPF